MANIRLDLDYPLEDGQSLTFKAPCDCTAITGIKVYYPTVTEGSSSTTSKVLTLKDAHGNTLTGIGNLFMTGAYVKVVADTVNNFAYIQNADTNAYLENKFSNIDVSTPISTHNKSTTAHEDIRTALNGKAASSHQHAAGDITSGTLPVARGGTGITSNPSMLTNLGSTSSASVFATSPRPGVTGTLGVGNGGTGVTSLDALATALGAPKMQIVSYKGTGTYEYGVYPTTASKATKITFGFAPKIIVRLMSSNSSGNQHLPIMPCSLIPTSGVGYYVGWGDNLQAPNIALGKSSDGKTFMWTTLDNSYNVSAASQLNDSSTTYYFMGLG